MCCLVLLSCLISFYLLVLFFILFCPVLFYQYCVALSYHLSMKIQKRKQPDQSQWIESADSIAHPGLKLFQIKRCSYSYEQSHDLWNIWQPTQRDRWTPGNCEVLFQQIEQGTPPPHTHTAALLFAVFICPLWIHIRMDEFGYFLYTNTTLVVKIIV